MDELVVAGAFASRLSKTVPSAFTRSSESSSILSYTEVLSEAGKLVESRAVKLSVNYWETQTKKSAETKCEPASIEILS
jgi:hypothetical protein